MLNYISCHRAIMVITECDSTLKVENKLLLHKLKC